MSDLLDVVDDAVRRTEERVRGLESRIQELHGDIEAFTHMASASEDARRIGDIRKQLDS